MTKRNLMKKLLVFTLVAAFASFAWLSLPSPDRAQAPGGSGKTASGSGLVQSVDKEKSVVTIKHGALPSLNMMAMTYAIKDKNQLAYDGNDYLITEIK